MKLSIAVPWYKSRESVQALYDRALIVFDSMSDFDQIEFVFVEDGGNDGTWEELIKLAHKDSCVKVARFSRNFGQHHALTACLDLSEGDWVVVMDCDMQDRPEEIPRLYAKTKEGFDMVCARRGKRQDRFWKRLSSRFFMATFNWLSGMNYDGEVGNFRILSHKMVQAYRRMGESTRNIPGQLHWLGFKTGFIDVVHGARYSGKSSYTLPKLIGLALDSIIAYSNKPLRLSIRVGVGLMVFSLCMAAWIFARKIFWGIPISGWASLMVSVWFIGGIIIGNLGIIGMYLGRIYDEVKGRPVYIIDESINISLQDSSNRRHM